MKKKNEGRNKKDGSGIQRSGKKMKKADGGSVGGKLKKRENGNLAEYRRNAY